MSNHSFHIPVMGTGFTIDTPIKVAHFGISSVVSLVDDTLIEQMREFYSKKLNRPYQSITKYQYNFRARRITAYLDLIQDMVDANFADVIDSGFGENTLLDIYFQYLDDRSELKQQYLQMLMTEDELLKKQRQKQLIQQLKPGTVDVNIMTKLDRNIYSPKRKPLPDAFSDALAALRGFALSRSEANIVFSAGINRRLYSYMTQFDGFFADDQGHIRKKIILKVSDYRSALTQGRFLAKKGLWVSEYRIESGLNCGGHAFASDGYLMGPILEEFRTKRQQLLTDLHELYKKACEQLGKPAAHQPLPITITAQGGIGTAKEHRFLLSYYNLDRTGWGSPFLLVPEATNVDDLTLSQLCSAGEKDVYLSEVSPLGVPFNNLKNSESDREKMRRAALNKPGSACPKGHLVSNTEFTDIPICTASRQYQKLKCDQLQNMGLSAKNIKKQFDQLVKKACICHDLGEGVLNKYKIPAKNKTTRFPAVCPGPNIAYFDKIVSLGDIIQHIYGRKDIRKRSTRPNMFIKELNLYLDYFFKEVYKSLEPTQKKLKYLETFKNNLTDGIDYYRQLIPKMIEESFEYRYKMLEDLQSFSKKLDEFMDTNAGFFNGTSKCVTVSV